MKLQLSKKCEEKSSLVFMGRFFLFFLIVCSNAYLLQGASTKNLLETDKESHKTNDIPKAVENSDKIPEYIDLTLSENPQQESPNIFVTNGAKIFISEDAAAASNIIVRNVDKKHESEDKKSKREKKNAVVKKKITTVKIAKVIPKKLPVEESSFTTNPKDQENIFGFSSGRSEIFIPTVQQIKMFTVRDISILFGILFLWSFCLIITPDENIFYAVITGKNFQRPPPCFL